ncbi:hypothetical protein K435DRAFT_655161, partial [Dendrothele bispora CBS 962.96]
TLIAYCIALIGRVFEGGSERGASILLKLIKVFGRALTMLNSGGETIEQGNAIDDIPDSITTLEGRLNLGISSVPYAVCPSCSCTYEPTYSLGSSEPVYQRQCSNKTSFGLCTGQLLDDSDQPLKCFHYYPFLAWFGKFLSLPGVEEYGDKFCEHITSHPETPSVQRNAQDGDFVRNFRANDDGLFVMDRGEEGRWFFKLYSDSFNVEGNRIRGPTTSTGVLALLCLNLPLSMSNDPAYTYLAGLIQGPNEPEPKEAAPSYYLQPLLRDLDLAYTRGVTPYRSARDATPYRRVHRVALSNAVMDLKAARPNAGLLDASSHHFCFICKCWHTAHLDRIDFQNWDPVDDQHLKKGATLWLEAQTRGERNVIEDIYGTRHSALWMLKYWRPSKQLVPDPMHTLILRVLQNFFRQPLGLENPDKKKPTTTTTKPDTFRAFYYDFSPPPHLSKTASTGQKPQNDPSEQISNDKIAFRQLSAIHVLLSGAAPKSKAEKKRYHDKLMNNKWNTLLYVCNDLMVFPRNDLRQKSRILVKEVQKKQMANVLMKWRRNKPFTSLKWARVDSSEVLRRVHLVISDLITPAWVAKPPSNVGLPKAGTLKADHWRTLFSIHLPLALLSLWGQNSPIRAENATMMLPVLKTTLFLSCALLMMTKDTLTPERRELFRNLYHQHVIGLRENFPGFFKPTHHLAFHIYDFMEPFSTVRNWWAFVFERFIGMLQRLPTNHTIGQLEKTILHGFNRGASFRQWLLHPDCPPLLAYCLKLLDKTYLYVRRGYSSAQHEDEDEENDNLTAENVLKLHENQKGLEKLGWILPSPPPQELISACGIQRPERLRCFSRTTAPRGFYTIPSAKAIGNSHVCFRDGTSWSPGQLLHIFDYSDGDMHVAIKRCVPLNSSLADDSFSSFWDSGFEAKTVSSLFQDKLEIMRKDAIIGHVARWELAKGIAVVLNLSRVRP